jgi:peroxiredoxin Q/BCP
VLGISLDSVADQARFHGEQELNFTLLSDPDGSAASKYGVLSGNGRFAARATFVIDPAGVLRAVDQDVQVTSHGEDLIELVKRLRG